MNRRDFIRTAAAAPALCLAPRYLSARETTRITILHTNDTHSRVDPFPMDGSRLQGLGGVARRATLIKRIREERSNVLLLDAGDIFQGTPYFNYFGGEIEFKAMSAMNYDAATLGNHDFDNGVDGLVKMLPHATFPLVCTNYTITDSRLAGAVRPELVRTFGQTKVGIFGTGIAFERLVLDRLHEGVSYTDPILAAQKAVTKLRELGCSLVICLSHLGYRYRDDRPSDISVANEVDGIDLILGGHTHTFLDVPEVIKKANGGQTLVAQTGWGGVRLGESMSPLTRPTNRFPGSPPNTASTLISTWLDYLYTTAP